MRTTVVPAINVSSPLAAQRELRLAARMGGDVQIDCADGSFVLHRTLGPAALMRLTPSGRTELHLMVKYPHHWLPAALALHVQRVAFHVESLRDPRPFIAALRVHHLAPILAINPTTPLSQVTGLVQWVRSVLLLGVTPGRSGGRFHPVVTSRLRHLRRRFPRLELGVDGGISETNIRTVAEAGANRIIVGSAIFQTANPVASFRSLQHALHG